MPIINSLEVLQTVAVVRMQLTTVSCNAQLTVQLKEAIVKANDDGNITVRENSTAKGGKGILLAQIIRLLQGKGGLASCKP